MNRRYRDDDHPEHIFRGLKPPANMIGPAGTTRRSRPTSKTRFRTGFRLVLSIAGLLALPTLAAQPLTLSQANGKPGQLKAAGDGSHQLRTAGGISLYATLTAPAPDGPQAIAFDYFCLGGIPAFAVLPGPPFDPKQARWSEPLGHVEAWTPHRIPLSADGGPLPERLKQFRFDLPITEDTSLQFRNVRLVPDRDGEPATNAQAHADTTRTLDAYLRARQPVKIELVTVMHDKIRISGDAGTLREGLAVAEVGIHSLLHDPDRIRTTTALTPDEDGRFELSLPRFIERDGHRHDRLLAKWQVVTPTAGGFQPLSHARYPDELACRNPYLRPANPKSKKGLGGWAAHRGPKGELKRLGIASITVNVTLQNLLFLKPRPGTFPVTWQGRTYHANREALERHDATFREAAEHDIMVSAILLIANPTRTQQPEVRLLGHPDAVPEGTYAMPNVTDETGLNYYGAILNLMAERWSRPDGKFGRVHHWIVHNEVDAGWTWTNCGPKELLPFVDLYHRSLRLVHLITRQHDPHARPFVSLTHHWAETVNPRFYPSRDILETLARFTDAEGDFPWALAHHPYPQSLRNPRTWEDRQATDSFDSKKITPHNIGVLDRWMRRPEMRYRGAELRPIHLSENGFNSPDYSEQSLRDQAAGMAYAWKKIAPLETIHAWQYHNWIDNRHEGGLRIGLRKFPDAEGDPHGPKPIWHLYQALATPREDEACRPYLQYINAQ